VARAAPPGLLPWPGSYASEDGRLDISTAQLRHATTQCDCSRALKPAASPTCDLYAVGSERMMSESPGSMMDMTQVRKSLPQAVPSSTLLPV
jgi:hypothetical protein